MKNKKVTYFFAIGLALLFLAGCGNWRNPFVPPKKSSPLKNQPPQTYIFLFARQDTSVVTEYGDHPRRHEDRTGYCDNRNRYHRQQADHSLVGRRSGR
ncbi:MAG: hypothetical protein GXO76_14665 [Calditrichaeota bacterium]|nr:hypothetical protein [Calditrichota bacterium]